MEYIIIAVLAVWLILALRSMRKKDAGCRGDCSQCKAACKDPDGRKK